MKIIKIGSGSNCDIRLESEFVSAYHAELLIMDNGELLLTDKGSTNGTFLKNKKISPNVEVPVKRGDLIRFADSELVWAYVPTAENLSKYKTVVNIGSNMLNDVVVNNALVSRFHAVLKVEKNGKVFLQDNNSKNGTQVNGVKIQSGKEIQIKRGDNIIIAGEDITQLLQPYFPTMPIMKFVKVLGLVAILAGVIWGITVLIPWNKDWSKEYKSAVVYVDAKFHYKIQFEDCPIHTDIWNGEINDIAGGYYSATAFFIDKEGRMATNRHAAVPWEYEDPNEIKSLKTDIQKFIDSQIPVEISYDNAEAMVAAYDKNGNGIWKFIKEQAIRDDDFTVRGLNSLIRQMKKCKYKIDGELDYIRVGYPGRNYTHEDEYERCFVLTESGTDDKDIALLQLNTKKTPDHIETVFNVMECETEKLVPQEDELVWIGYPRGNLLNLDKTINSMEPNIRNTRCSRPQSKYTFEFQGESIGGASGSPIFNKKTGKLVGVLFGHWAVGSTFGRACQAKYLKEMYKEEVGL